MTRRLQRNLLRAAVPVITITGAASATAPAGYVDASSFGFDATDATSALQSAIDTGSNVYVPNMGMDWNVRPITLLNSNQQILFESGAVVAAKKGAFLGNTPLFNALGCSNVKMIGYGATLKMRKSDYTQAPYPASEFRHGISMTNVNNFEIRGLTVQDTGGDGIYVGASQGTYSASVTIKDVVLKNNYRQGISVISAKDLLIDNALIRDTSGTSPEAGIDFEPNYSTQRLQNIVVRNSILTSNASFGMIFGTTALTSQSLPVTGTIENVTIFANDYDGIAFVNPLPNVVVKDSLLTNNLRTQARGYTTPGPGVTNNSLDYSAFTGGTLGALAGSVALGPGSVTNLAPVFISTNPDNPYFLYLASNTPVGIRQGASDGGYMGARPVLVINGPTWGVNSSGDWNAAGNWLTGVVPNAAGASATLGIAISSRQTIFANSAITLGSLTIDNPNSYSIAGFGPLTMQSAGTAAISVLQGSQNINLPVVFASNTTVNVSSGATLTISNPLTIKSNKTVTKSGNLVLTAPLTIESGGVFTIAAGAMALPGAPFLAVGAGLDVQSGQLQINDPSAMPQVLQMLRTGYADGLWTGAGIANSAAIAGHTGLGWTEVASDHSIIVKPALYGDADLNGQVDSIDFIQFSLSYSSLANAVWTQGDFNYDGKITTTDFNLLAGNFGTAASFAPILGSVVPEPTFTSLFLAGFAGLFQQRHRTRLMSIASRMRSVTSISKGAV